MWVAEELPRTRLTIPSFVLTLAGYSVLLIASCLEHVRSWHPSTLLCVYLGISILLDLPRIRTTFALFHGQAIPGLLLGSLLVKVLLFICEVSEKRRLLLQEWRNLSYETTSSVLSRSLFIWLNRLLITGFRSLLTVNLLTSIDDEMLAASRPTQLKERWLKSKCSVGLSCA